MTSPPPPGVPVQTAQTIPTVQIIHPAPPPRKSHHTLLQALQSLLYIIVVALFLLTFTVQPFRIPSASMEPTLLVGDFLLADKQIGPEAWPSLYAPAGLIHRGDIIVFHYPVNPSLHLVKRVVGLPGDRLRLHQGRVLLNDHATSEPFAVFRPTIPDTYRDEFPRNASADPSIDPRWWLQMRSLVAHGELTVPPASYFVLGDNRNDSDDSRYWGLVPEANIIGKPFLIYFSLDQPDEPRSAPPAVSPDATPGTLPPDKLSTADLARHFTRFARWNRILHIIH